MMIWCVPKNLIRVKGSVQVLGEVERFVLLSYFLSGLLLRMSCSSREIWKKEDYGSIERCKSAAAFVLEKKKRWQLLLILTFRLLPLHFAVVTWQNKSAKSSWHLILSWNSIYYTWELKLQIVLTFDTHYPHTSEPCLYFEWTKKHLSAKKQIGKHFFKENFCIFCERSCKIRILKHFCKKKNLVKKKGLLHYLARKKTFTIFFMVFFFKNGFFLGI